MIRGLPTILIRLDAGEVQHLVAQFFCQGVFRSCSVYIAPERYVYDGVVKLKGADDGALGVGRKGLDRVHFILDLAPDAVAVRPWIDLHDDHAEVLRGGAHQAANPGYAFERVLHPNNHGFFDFRRVCAGVGDLNLNEVELKLGEALANHHRRHDDAREDEQQHQDVGEYGITQDKTYHDGPTGCRLVPLNLLTVAAEQALQQVAFLRGGTVAFERVAPLGGKALQFSV